MPTASTPQEFVILPLRGIQATPATPQSAVKVLCDLASFFAPDLADAVVEAAGDIAEGVAKVLHGVEVLHSLGEEGAKLVRMTAKRALELRAEEPGLRVVPVTRYGLPSRVPALASSPTGTKGSKSKTRVRVVGATDGKPVVGAMVVAFTDFEERVGVQAVTTKDGVATLGVKGPRKFERVFVVPETPWSWGSHRRNLKLSNGTEIRVPQVTTDQVDEMRRRYAAPASGDTGAKVRVGVIDTGIAKHPDLVVEGGLNAVTGEAEGLFRRDDHGHGTHVAGIVASRGKGPDGMWGLAPGVALRSYRVFPGADSKEPFPGARNYDVVKAIDAAVKDGCDILNLSLKWEGDAGLEAVVEDALKDAREKGVLPIVAAGNDHGSPVSYPARSPLAIAVTAFGRKGTFPPRALASGDVSSVHGSDAKDFLASFSNRGGEVDLTAPGVGVLSTYRDGYGAMSGTSMACPVVTGVAARLLSAESTIREAPRDTERSAAIAKLLLDAASKIGFPADAQGLGWPKG
jgi:subtilisin